MPENTSVLFSVVCRTTHSRRIPIVFSMFGHRRDTFLKISRCSVLGVSVWQALENGQFKAVLITDPRLHVLTDTPSSDAETIAPAIPGKTPNFNLRKIQKS